MMKDRIIEKCKSLRAYLVFRKLRMILHYKPSYHKMKDFIKHYLGGLYIRTEEHHVFLLAGGLAFSLFVCAIPFVLILFSVLGSILDSSYMQYQVNTFIEAVIPYYRYSEYVKKIIFTRIDEVIQYKALAGIIGGFGLLFAASGLFSSMRTILNKIFGVEISVNLLLGKLRDFALIVIVVLVFFITTISMPIIELIRQAAESSNLLSDVFSSVILEQFLFSTLSLVVIFISFSFLYIAVPIKKMRKRSIFLGAFWAAVLWEGAKLLFGFYLHHFSSLGKIYGTYTLIVVVAFWVYYSSVVFIIGAEIARLTADRLYARDAAD